MAIQENKFTANGLILDSLEVKNFRAFKHLTIEKLGRVNLITGKNNVGKTTLLEALWLYARRRSPEVLRNLLANRDELTLFQDTNLFNLNVDFNAPREYSRIDAPTNDHLWFSFTTLLHMGDGVFNTGTAIISVPGKDTISIAVRAEDISLEQDGRTIYTASFDEIYYEPRDVKRRIGDPTPLVSEAPSGEIPAAFVESLNYDLDYQSDLWEEAKREGRKVDALEGLRLIVPDVEDIEFAETSPPGRSIRKVNVSLSNKDASIPLSGFGEGAKRLLAIALAMVHAENGILIIDEVENGLHYSVLRNVWKHLFEMAERLNVQVFATTHSWECIEAFHEAADEDDDLNSGVLVRLENKGGDVVATVADERSLDIITRDGIEVR